MSGSKDIEKQLSMMPPPKKKGKQEGVRDMLVRCIVIWEYRIGVLADLAGLIADLRACGGSV